MRTALPLLLVLASLPSLASADAIGPPPTDCPEGSMPITCHGPDTCAVAPCTNDGDCGAGMHCEERALCITPHCCGGIGCAGGGGPPPPMVSHVEGPCGAGGTCTGTASCSTGRVCVPGAASTDGGSSDSGTPGTDSGTSDTDSGAGATDSGATPMDSGSAGTDAGTTSSSGGGCCSVLGARDPRVPLALLALALATVIARRCR